MSACKNAPWHTVDGKHYGVPYQWGANVLAYNTNVFKEPPKSWSVVFEETNLPDGKSNKGRVQAFDGAIYIADAALYLMKKQPELGIKDPYELNEEQYKAALDLLRKQRLLVGRYWHDAFIQIDDFKNEGVVASSSWPFQVNLLQADKKPIASTVPEEGATGWADTTMMHAEAAHPNCAYMWLEHSINPKLQGDLAAWFGSVPAVPAACTGNALLTDAGLRNQWRRKLRQDPFLEDAGRQMREPAEWLRSLLSLGDGLHRGSRRALSAAESAERRDLRRRCDARGGRGLKIMAIAVRFEGVSRHFGNVRAVDDVSLDIAEGEFFAMLGPSGSGKTTCLRLIAGFEQPDRGHIEIFGQTAEGVPPYRRNVNTVFQDYALFPHMTVGDNVAYGLMIRGVSRPEREARASAALAMVKLPGYESPPPGPAFGRPAPAGGPGPRPHQRPQGAAPG